MSSDYYETGVDAPSPADIPEPEHVPPLWQREPLLDSTGQPRYCDHRGCFRYAVRIVAYEAPKHREFGGQTHDCCSVHSRPRRTS